MSGIFQTTALLSSWIVRSLPRVTSNSLIRIERSDGLAMSSNEANMYAGMGYPYFDYNVLINSM